ncbi:protein of unknown function [Brevefilum fermentans]|uniref:Uncharacterized protein n=1 Tax=Candidatus Brevifilum fermentans TaxID=1986204 RepID=A0A1Y6K8F6_9CHLR|nr:protein of unknown function [Brevefilum fermentans]
MCNRVLIEHMNYNIFTATPKEL